MGLAKIPIIELKNKILFYKTPYIRESEILVALLNANPTYYQEKKYSQE